MRLWLIGVALACAAGFSLVLLVQDRAELKRTLREQEQQLQIMQQRYTKLQQGILQELEGSKNAEREVHAAYLELDVEDRMHLDADLPAALRDRLCGIFTCH
jgi:hypothetical protein